MVVLKFLLPLIGDSMNSFVDEVNDQTVAIRLPYSLLLFPVVKCSTFEVTLFVPVDLKSKDTDHSLSSFGMTVSNVLIVISCSSFISNTVTSPETDLMKKSSV